MSKLADLIHGASKSREAAQVAEIVSGGNAHRRGKFSEACDSARQETADAEFSKAQDYLLKNPYLVDSPGGKGTFFEKFQNASMDKLRTLVDRVYEFRHPSSVDGDAPEAEPGEISRRSR
jgi:hypothetical protein